MRRARAGAQRIRPAPLGVVLTIGVLCAASAACADFSPIEDQSGGLPDVVVTDPSFRRDVQPIFTKRCAQGGCHTFATQQAGLVLEQGAAYDLLVGVQSTHSTLPRVSPGDHAGSWLWRVVQPDEGLRPGFPRMPLAAQPLTPNQIQTIVNWIDQGAADN